MEKLWCVEFSPILKEFRLNTITGVQAKNQRLALDGETDGFTVLKVSEDFDELTTFISDFKRISYLRGE